MHRRYLTFSLRSLLFLVTVLSIWLGAVVNRAREQREAVRNIEAARGAVEYDWEPAGWLRRHRRSIALECFRKVESVQFRFPSPEYELLRVVPCLRRIDSLNAVSIGRWVSSSTEAKLKAALPDCEVRLCNELRFSRPATSGAGEPFK
jgi:hypothetical protein